MITLIGDEPEITWAIFEDWEKNKVNYRGTISQRWNSPNKLGRRMGNFIMAPFIKYIHAGNGQRLRLNLMLRGRSSLLEI
ncbi:hypothetical protein J14TS5_49500 [Paenibacillus lautus]|nr:hypothetical protein J14TS5_49500 [Paenibacillus lautus]